MGLRFWIEIQGSSHYSMEVPHVALRTHAPSGHSHWGEKHAYHLDTLLRHSHNACSALTIYSKVSIQLTGNVPTTLANVMWGLYVGRVRFFVTSIERDFLILHFNKGSVNHQNILLSRLMLKIVLHYFFFLHKAAVCIYCKSTIQPWSHDL